LTLSNIKLKHPKRRKKVVGEKRKKEEKATDNFHLDFHGSPTLYPALHPPFTTPISSATFI
jgi:hypothetical protein